MTSFDESRPSSSGAAQNPVAPHRALSVGNLDKLSNGPDYEEMPENGYFEGPDNDSRPRPDLVSSGVDLIKIQCSKHKTDQL